MLSVQSQPLDLSAPAAVKRASSEGTLSSKWLTPEPPSLDTSIRTSSSYDDEEEGQPPEDEEMVAMELGQCQSQAPKVGGDEEAMTQQKSVAPTPLVVPPVVKGMGPTFFSLACSRSLFIAMVTFTAAVALAAVLAHLERHIGLTLLSLLPAIFMMTYLHHLFPLCVLRQEMLLTFFLAILYMGPLVILENLWYFGVLTKSRLDNAGFATHSSPALTWAYKLLSSFVRAYLVAGIFEEGAKFLALRRLRTLPYVTDPRALVTYGLCAGAAFGTVENLFIYAFAYGIDNTIARAFLSVPLHAMTGMLIACALAEDRFLALSSLPPSESPLPFRPWWRIVAASVLVHGSFDLIDFLFAEDYDVVSLVVEVVVVVAGFAYVRFCLLRLLMAVPIEDDLQKRIGREKQVAAAVAALAVLVAEEEEGRDLGVAGGREEWGMQGRSGGGGLEIPTMKHVLKVVGAACVCCTGMLLFLYLCPLS